MGGLKAHWKSWTFVEAMEDQKTSIASSKRDGIRSPDVDDVISDSGTQTPARATNKTQLTRSHQRQSSKGKIWKSDIKTKSPNEAL
jgi:hypothetical protein